MSWGRGQRRGQTHTHTHTHSLFLSAPPRISAWHSGEIAFGLKVWCSVWMTRSLYPSCSLLPSLRPLFMFCNKPHHHHWQAVWFMTPIPQWRHTDAAPLPTICMYFSFPLQPSPCLGYTSLSLSFALSLSVPLFCALSLPLSHTHTHTHLKCGDWLSLQDCLVYFWFFWNLISLSSTRSVSSHIQNLGKGI